MATTQPDTPEKAPSLHLAEAEQYARARENPMRG